MKLLARQTLEDKKFFSVYNRAMTHAPECLGQNLFASVTERADHVCHVQFTHTMNSINGFNKDSAVECSSNNG
jgi:hypothetical protein